MSPFITNCSVQRRRFVIIFIQYDARRFVPTAWSRLLPCLFEPGTDISSTADDIIDILIVMIDSTAAAAAVADAASDIKQCARDHSGAARTLVKLQCDGPHLRLSDDELSQGGVTVQF